MPVLVFPRQTGPNASSGLTCHVLDESPLFSSSLGRAVVPRAGRRFGLAYPCRRHGRQMVLTRNSSVRSHLDLGAAALAAAETTQCCRGWRLRHHLRFLASFQAPPSRLTLGLAFSLSAAATLAAALQLMPFMITAVLASSSPTCSIERQSTRST